MTPDTRPSRVLGDWLTSSPRATGISAVRDTVGLEGTSSHRLKPSTPLIASAPGSTSRRLVSPDGRKIAFLSDRSGDLELWILRRGWIEPRPADYIRRSSCAAAPLVVRWAAASFSVHSLARTVVLRVFHLQREGGAPDR